MPLLEIFCRAIARPDIGWPKMYSVGVVNIETTYVMRPVGVNLRKHDGRAGVSWRLMQQGGGQEGLHEMRGHINLTPHHWSRHVRKNWQSLWGFVHTLAY